jgi:hypothetical protein
VALELLQYGADPYRRNSHGLSAIATSPVSLKPLLAGVIAACFL